MLVGTSYQTPEFYCTKLNGEVYRYATRRCAESWSLRTVKHDAIERPKKVLGFRSGTLLQDFKSSSIWYVVGSGRYSVDYDAWTKHSFSFKDVVVCSRHELELHEPKGEL